MNCTNKTFNDNFVKYILLDFISILKFIIYIFVVYFSDCVIKN